MSQYSIIITMIFIWSFSFNAKAQTLSSGTIDFIFRPENNITQFAIWLEDENNTYIETVFTTNFMGRRGGGNRTSDTDIDSNSGNRLSALPVWAYKRNVIDTTFGIENYYPPAETRASYPADIDAVSRATPNSNIQTKTWSFSNLSAGIYTCWIEANKSFDFNTYHNYSFYRGQPSVVWKATLVVSDFPDTGMTSDYFGYGSPDGSDGDIHPPDSTITTAADLLDDLGGYRFKVIYTPTSTGVNDTDHNARPVHSFYLEQNYPNPFNASAEIGYFLPDACHLRLPIYDIRGRMIAVLTDEEQTAGDKRVYWNGKNKHGKEVISGIYFYKLDVGQFTETKRMVLIK